MDYHAASHSAIEQSTLLIDIATRNVVRLAPDDSVGEAARIMAEKRISSIVVTDQGGHPSGIVTERNMLHAMQSGCPPETALRIVMSSPVITVPESMTCLDAYQVCLRDGIRHLVIVDQDKRLLGVVSETDFRLHINLSTVSGRNQVASIMSRSVFSMPPEATLRDALNLMQAHRDTCIVVVDAEYPIGIVTERDIVRLYSDNPARTDFPIREVMTSPVLTVSQEYSINEAAERMSAIKVRHLVVVDRLGRLAGLLSEHDLTHAMTLGLIDDKLIAEGAFLHTLVNTIPDMVWLKDVNGVYLACNPRFERFFGAKEKDIVGKTDYDFVDRELADFFREHDRKAMEKDGKSVNEEWVAYADDGHRELLETLKTPMRDSQGKLIGVLGIARDITEHRRLEEKLEESVKKFHCIFESACDCIELISMNGLIMDLNHVGYEWLGYKKAEMQGHRLAEFGTPEYAARVPEGMALIKSQGHAKFESARLRKDGSIMPIEVSSRIVELDGQPMFLSISRDITERKQAEQALRESEEKLRGLYELSPLGIALTGMSGHYVEFNESFRRICGYSGEELKALDYWDLTPKKYETDEARQLESLTSTGRYGPYEKEYVRKDGSLVPLRLNGVLVTSRDGQKYIWSIVEDITEHKRAEEALRENEAKYRQLFETAGDGIFLQDASGFIDCNEKGASLYGLSREEIINRSPTDLAPERQPDGRLSSEVAGKMIAAALRGEPQQFEWRSLRANGDPLDVDINLNRIELGGTVCLQAVVRDISERKRAELQLRESELQYRTLADSGQALIWTADTDKLCDYFNKVWLEFTGRSLQQEIGNGWIEGVHPDDLQRCLDIYVSSFDRREKFGMDYRLRRHDGEYRWIRDEGSPRHNSEGEFIGYIGFCLDITERKHAEDSLRIIAGVFDTSQEAILITDANNVIVDVNPAFTQITSYSREEVLGHNPKLLSSGRHDSAFYGAMWRSLKQERAWRGEIWNRRKSGEIYVELLSISVICDDDGKVQRHVGVFSDISYLKEHEAELSHVAHYDALTGIPNRVLLADRMNQAIAKTAREQNRVAVCYLDLDGFKSINDTIGHDAGDQVLVEVSRRIGDTIRGGDTVARLGGDEFVVLLELEKGEECVATLERLLAVIAQPITIKNQPQMLSASIGVSIYPLDNEDSDTLLRHADQAMYIAKQSGKNRFFIYDPELDLRVRDRNEFLKNIRHGLERDQFELYFQPKIDLLTKRLVGAEALIRWRHPERGLLSPVEFLRPIENTELDIEIGNWVIATALAQINRWHGAGLDIEVSINISAYHLESSGFVEKLQQQLARYSDLPPGKLQIEILETAALNDLAIVRGIIEECREIGVGFALDDFGTGYSSLSYLSKLPVDVLKIDQSFVRDMLEDKGDNAIIQGIIALAQAFDRQVVAEGIETEEHYRALLNMGCQIGQGYVIARPMPANELTNWQSE